MCGKCFLAMDIRHSQYLGTAPMNQLTEVTRGGEGSGRWNTEEEGEVSCSQSSCGYWWHFWRSSEYQWNYNWVSRKNWTCRECWKYWEIWFSIFTLAVENLQFKCDKSNRTNFSEKGLTRHMWMKHSISNRFFQRFSYILDRVHHNSPSMHFRRVNTDSGGPIGIQEGQYGFRRANTDSGGPIWHCLCILGRPIRNRLGILGGPIRKPIRNRI